MRITAYLKDPVTRKSAQSAAAARPWPIARELGVICADPAALTLLSAGPLNTTCRRPGEDRRRTGHASRLSRSWRRHFERREDRDESANHRHLEQLAGRRQWWARAADHGG